MAKPSGSSGTIPCLSLSLFLSLFLSLSLCTFVLLNLPLSLLDSPNSQWAETALIYMYHEFFLFSISCYFSYRAHPLPYIPLRTPLLSPALPLLLLLVFHLFHLFLLLVLILLLLLPSFSSSFSSSSYFSFFLSSSFLSSFFSSFSSCSLAPIVPWLRLRTNSLRIAVH